MQGNQNVNTLESALLPWNGPQSDMPVNVCSEILEFKFQSFKLNYYTVNR